MPYISRSIALPMRASSDNHRHSHHSAVPAFPTTTHGRLAPELRPTSLFSPCSDLHAKPVRKPNHIADYCGRLTSPRTNTPL